MNLCITGRLEAHQCNATLPVAAVIADLVEVPGRITDDLGAYFNLLQLYWLDKVMLGDITCIQTHTQRKHPHTSEHPVEPFVVPLNQALLTSIP